MPAAHRVDLPQGTLDLLILQTLVLEPQHGWAISERVQQISSDVLRIQQGSLYPALHRLERRGWIKACWGTSENNRRAKFYELTKSGRRQLEVEKDNWIKLTAEDGVACHCRLPLMELPSRIVELRPIGDEAPAITGLVPDRVDAEPEVFEAFTRTFSVFPTSAEPNKA